MARLRNITLSLPDDLVKRAKPLAVEEDISVSKLLATYLEQFVAQRDGYRTARVRALARLQEGFPVAPVSASYDWRREDLHARDGSRGCRYEHHRLRA